MFSSFDRLACNLKYNSDVIILDLGIIDSTYAPTG